MTRHIAKALDPLDTLDLIEANTRFTDRLEHLLHSDPELRPAASRITVLTGLVQDFDLGDYDAIVCGLPFANLDATSAEAILSQLLQALSPAGTLSFFAYAGVPRLRRVLTFGRARHRTIAAQCVVDKMVKRHLYDQNFVAGNLPPAWVHHLVPRQVAAQAGRRMVPSPSSPSTGRLAAPAE